MSNIIYEQEMKTEQFINDFIKREKQVEPNPFLSTRVIAAIEKPGQTEVEKVPVWQTVLVVTSFVFVAFLGVSLGNTYVDKATSEMVVNINDSQIENLGFYNLDDYE